MINVLFEDPLWQKIALIIFILAIVHTFMSSKVELIFGFWFFIYLSIVTFFLGPTVSFEYLKSLHLSEAIFVTCMMFACSTRPVLQLGAYLMLQSTHLLKIKNKESLLYFNLLWLGPLLGSVISEPAAMTIIAILFQKKFSSLFHHKKFAYVTLAALLVNVSVGGTLTNFAAPPIVMVARPWNWSTSIVFHLIGWKAIFICFFNALLAFFWVRNILKNAEFSSHETKVSSPPLWKESLLVGFFLASIIALGNVQAWWISQLISQASQSVLLFGATLLTSVTDNAALTYLATLVPNLPDAAKVAIVEGAVAGGGLTVLANAPNPIAFHILGGFFPQQKISPLYLLQTSFWFTCVAVLFFYF